jgi:hypothetical protein
VAIFQGVNQTVAGVNLSHVYQRTGIPLAGVPSPYQGQIQATVSATSRSSALHIVANVRRQYQNCVNAYTAVQRYTAAQTSYKSRLTAYEKRYHTKGDVRLKGKVIHTPPKPPTGTQPTIPADCPGPSATGTTGSGGSS